MGLLGALSRICGLKSLAFQSAEIDFSRLHVVFPSGLKTVTLKEEDLVAGEIVRARQSAQERTCTPLNNQDEILEGGIRSYAMADVAIWEAATENMVEEESTGALGSCSSRRKVGPVSAATSSPSAGTASSFPKAGRSTGTSGSSGSSLPGENSSDLPLRSPVPGKGKVSSSTKASSTVGSNPNFSSKPAVEARGTDDINMRYLRGRNLMACNLTTLKGDVIGSGGFGTVYSAVIPWDPAALVRCRFSKAPEPFKVAIKVVRRENAFNELGAFHNVEGCPYIAQQFHTRICGDDRYFVMELIDGCSMADCIAMASTRSDRFPAWLIRRDMNRLARGLQAMHEANYVHNDIKPDNLRYTRDSELKLVDLGLATRVGFTYYAHGTPGFLAPEVAEVWDRDALVTYTPAVDWWGAGMVLLHMLLLGDEEMCSLVVLLLEAGLLNNVWDVLKKFSCCDKPLLQLLVKLLQQDPAQRL